jgi:hypothetical protein
MMYSISRGIKIDWITRAQEEETENKETWHETPREQITFQPKAVDAAACNSLENWLLLSSSDRNPPISIRGGFSYRRFRSPE